MDTRFHKVNDECADFLMRIGLLYRKVDSAGAYRATAFEIAADVIRAHPENISMLKDFCHIESIGKSINLEIKEYLAAKTSSRYSSLMMLAKAKAKDGDGDKVCL